MYEYQVKRNRHTDVHYLLYSRPDSLWESVCSYLIRENKRDYFFFQIENDHIKSGFDLLRADLYLYVHMLYVFI